MFAGHSAATRAGGAQARLDEPAQPLRVRGACGFVFAPCRDGDRPKDGAEQRTAPGGKPFSYPELRARVEALLRRADVRRRPGA